MTKLELIIGVIIWVTIAFWMGFRMSSDKRCECDDCPYKNVCRQGNNSPFNLENKITDLKEAEEHIVNLDDETLFRYNEEASALADELSKELLRREP